jgi:hypothetical protein
MRTCGKFFYILTLTTQQRTLVYDQDLEIWMEWADSSGNSYPVIGVSYDHSSEILWGQDQTNGRLYQLDVGISNIDDQAGSFLFRARTKRFDSGNMKRKFCTSLDLIGDMQSSTTNVDIAYSDDDYATTSTARTLDMSTARPFGKAWGNFRRRSWQVSYTGSNPCRIVGIEINYSIGDY